MRIAVIGAGGWLGGAIAREALARGHEVTAIGRDASKLEAVQGARPAVVDATDASALPTVIAGHDVVVQSVTDRSGADRSAIPATTAALIRAVPEAGGPRLVVLGGGGSLLNDDGARFIDMPDFPEEYRTEAAARSPRAISRPPSWTSSNPRSTAARASPPATAEPRGFGGALSASARPRCGR